jgi:hypothetical protein
MSYSYNPAKSFTLGIVSSFSRDPGTKRVYSSLSGKYLKMFLNQIRIYSDLPTKHTSDGGLQDFLRGISQVFLDIDRREMKHQILQNWCNV